MPIGIPALRISSSSSMSPGRSMVVACELTDVLALPASGFVRIRDARGRHVEVVDPARSPHRAGRLDPHVRCEVEAVVGVHRAAPLRTRPSPCRPSSRRSRRRRLRMSGSAGTTSEGTGAVATLTIVDRFAAVSTSTTRVVSSPLSGGTSSRRSSGSSSTSAPRSLGSVEASTQRASPSRCRRRH